MVELSWPQNRLLLSMSGRDRGRLLPQLEQVNCSLGQVLLDADSSLEDVFFPDSGVISIGAFFGATARLRREDAAQSIFGSDGNHGAVPKADGRVYSSLHGTGSCLGRVQRSAQPDAAAR